MSSVTVPNLTGPILSFFHLDLKEIVDHSSIREILIYFLLDREAFTSSY